MGTERCLKGWMVGAVLVLFVLVPSCQQTLPLSTDSASTTLPRWVATGEGKDNHIFIATGEGPDNYFGRSVGTAGDVNGDGYDDIIVGAQAYDNNTGRAYVYVGGPDGLSASPVFTANGEGPSSSFGQSVGAAGDVN